MVSIILIRRDAVGLVLWWAPFSKIIRDVKGFRSTINGAIVAAEVMQNPICSPGAASTALYAATAAFRKVLVQESCFGPIYTLCYSW